MLVDRFAAARVHLYTYVDHVGYLARLADRCRYCRSTVPTTAARHGNKLALVNAKFDTGIPPTAGQYEVVLVDR